MNLRKNWVFSQWMYRNTFRYANVCGNNSFETNSFLTKEAGAVSSFICQLIMCYVGRLMGVLFGWQNISVMYFTCASALMYRDLCFVVPGESGSASLPRTRPARPTCAPAALQPSVCVPTSQVSAGAPLWGVPQIHWGPQRRVPYR